MSYLIREIKNILTLCLRYLIVVAILSILMMSLVSGQFPPPMSQYYKSFRSVQESINVEDLTANLRRAQEQRREQFKSLEDDSVQKVANQTPEVNSANRIQALEYEVAYLKAKLAQVEFENQQLKKNQTLDQGTVKPEELSR